MIALATEMSTPQHAAYAALFLFSWGGLAVGFGIAIGKSIKRADRRDAAAGLPGDAGLADEQLDRVIELGTRVDRWA